MANYKLDSIDLNAGRSELHNALALTGCEVSCNNLPQAWPCPSFTATKTTRNATSFSKVTVFSSSTARNSPLRPEAASVSIPPAAAA